MRSLLKENSTLLDVALRALDPLLIVVTGFLAYWLYLADWDIPSRYVIAIVVAAFLGFATFPALGLYQSRRGTSFVDELSALFLAWLLIAVSGGAFLFLTKTGADFSRGFSLIWIFGGFVVHVLSRAALRGVLRSLRRHGRNLRHVIIVGAGALGRGVAARLRAAPWTGLAVRAFYDDDPALIGASQDGIPVAGPLDRLPADLLGRPADQVWLALPLRAE